MADNNHNKDHGKKLSERAVGIVIAILGIVLIGAAIYFTSNLSGGADHNAPASDVLGPETVDAGSVQTAFSDTTAPPQIPATRSGPVELETDYLSFHTTMPAGPSDDPVLAYLEADAKRYLDRIRANAEAEQARQKKAGGPGHAWSVEIAWEYTAKAGDIVSLAGTADEYTGGAHPTVFYDTHIARTSGEPINFDAMFLAGKSPSPAVQIGVCEALKAEKKSKIGAETIFDEPIVCAGPDANAKTEQAAIALAPSDRPGKFGGIYAYYSPYIVGASVEGGYQLVVQQGVFAEDLKPEFKALFEGEAPAIGDDAPSALRGRTP